MLVLSKNHLNTLYSRYSSRRVYQEREMWITIAALIVTLTSGVFYRSVYSIRNRNKSRFSFTTALIIFSISLILLDIPLTRISYNYQINSIISPIQEAIRNNFTGCNLYKSDKSSSINSVDHKEPCDQYCSAIYNAANARQTIMWQVRQSHIIGNLAARIFDMPRGVTQETKIDKLFATRTCSRILESLTKTNNTVNKFCIILSVIVATMLFTSLIDIINHITTMNQKPSILNKYLSKLGIADFNNIKHHNE